MYKQWRRYTRNMVNPERSTDPMSLVADVDATLDAQTSPDYQEGVALIRIEVLAESDALQGIQLAPLNDSAMDMLGGTYEGAQRIVDAMQRFSEHRMAVRRRRRRLNNDTSP